MFGGNGQLEEAFPASSTFPSTPRPPSSSCQPLLTASHTAFPLLHMHLCFPPSALTLQGQHPCQVPISCFQCLLLHPILLQTDHPLSCCSLLPCSETPTDKPQSSAIVTISFSATESFFSNDIFLQTLIYSKTTEQDRSGCATQDPPPPSPSCPGAS